MVLCCTGLALLKLNESAFISSPTLVEAMTTLQQVGDNLAAFLEGRQLTTADDLFPIAAGLIRTKSDPAPDDDIQMSLPPERLPAPAAPASSSSSSSATAMDTNADGKQQQQQDEVPARRQAHAMFLEKVQGFLQFPFKEFSSVEELHGLRVEFERSTQMSAEQEQKSRMRQAIKDTKSSSKAGSSSSANSSAMDTNADRASKLGKRKVDEKEADAPEDSGRADKKRRRMEVRCCMTHPS